MNASEIISELMEIKGIKRKWLAEKMHLTKSTLSLKFRHNRMTYTDFFTALTVMGEVPDEYEYVKK